MTYIPQVNADTLQLYVGTPATGRAVAGSTTLDTVVFTQLPGQSAPCVFTPADVGMPIAIIGGGPVNPLMPPIFFTQGGLFHTTIAAYVSPSQVTLAAAPTTGIFNTGFPTIIVYRRALMASDVATGVTAIQFSSSIAPGTRDTLNFTVLAADSGGYIERFQTIAMGQPVYLTSTDGSVGDIFGGEIDTLQVQNLVGAVGTYSWTCTCASWAAIAGRRVVPPATPQTLTGTGDVVFSTIVYDYLNDEGISASGATAPSISIACPVGAFVNQLLDQVVQLLTGPTSQWFWNVDPWRNFTLFTRAGVAAPWNIDDTSVDLFAGSQPLQLAVVSTHNQMANQVYAIGTNVLLNALDVTLVGDGTSTTFQLPQNIGAAPTITLNGGAQTVGIQGVDIGKNWYWSQGSATLTQDAAGPILAITDSLLVVYQTSVSAVAQAPNVGSLQQRSDDEATSGSYDYVIQVSQVIAPADLLTLAETYAAQYGDPAQTVSITTLRPGLATGQLQNIVQSVLGISGDFLIATMSMTTVNNVIQWAYTAFGGANIGDGITGLVQFINRGAATLTLINPTQVIQSAAVVTTPVQQSVAGNYFSPVTMPNPVSVGNLLVVVAERNLHLGSPPTISDTLGNVWTEAIHGVNPAGGNEISILWAISNANGADTVTMPLTGGANGPQVFFVFEFSGIVPALPLDAAVTGVVAPAITTTQTFDLIVTGLAGGATSYSVTGTETLAAQDTLPPPSLPGLAVSWILQPSAGAFTTSLAGNVTPSQVYATAAFKSSASFTPPPPVPVIGNPAGTVTHTVGALTSGEPVIGNGGGDVTVGTKTGVTSEFVTASGAGSTGEPVLWGSTGDVDAGVIGQLVPAGGNLADVLSKMSGTNYDTTWMPLGLGAVPVVVQAAAAAKPSGQALAFTSNCTAGNLSVIFVGLSGSLTGAWTATDTLGTVYSLVITYANPAVPNTGAFLIGRLTASGANTVTLAGVTGGFNGPSICVMEVSGADGIVDATATNNGTMPSITTVAENDLIVGGVSVNGAQTFSATAPSVLDASASGGAGVYGIGIGSLDAPTPGAYTPAILSTDTTFSANIAIALKAAHGPGLPPGGTTGQVLEKTTDADYDTEWVTAAAVSVTTKGDLQGFSTVAARIPVGTDGDVLTADSTAALGVSYQPSGGGGGGGGLVLLEQHTASSSAELDFTACISSSYDEYLIEVVNLLPATNGIDFWLQFSQDGGATYDATSGHYQWNCLRWIYAGTAISASNGDTKIVITDGNAQVPNTAVNGGICGSFRLYNPLSTIMYKRLKGGEAMFYATPIDLDTQMGGTYLQTAAANAFRILASSGNIASGTVRVYGLEK